MQTSLKTTIARTLVGILALGAVYLISRSQTPANQVPCIKPDTEHVTHCAPPVPQCAPRAVATHSESDGNHGSCVKFNANALVAHQE